MQTLYNKLAKYFDLIAATSHVDTAKETAFLDTIFKAQQVHSVLDIACGTGRHSIALAHKGYQVTGIDYSPDLLAVAKAKAQLPQLHFIQQDVANITLDTTFDAAICMWSTLGELPYQRMLSGLKAVLKPGGLFIIDGSYFASVPAKPSHKTFKNTVDNITFITEIDESYAGKTRTRNIVNTINGEKVYDHSEMDVFTEADYLELLAHHGFEHVKTYYNYLPAPTEELKRIQLIFRAT